MVRIGIVDYQAGNLKSVLNALKYIGNADPFVVSAPKDLNQCDKIVLPGVGAFRSAITNLKELGFIDALHDFVLQKEKPFLGICLGMQLVMEKSHEHGETSGFAWIKGEVLPFDEKINLSVPHMGWNDIILKQNDTFVEEIENGTDFYFLHSYYVKCQDMDNVVATCRYGIEFDAIIRKNNIFAVQFHPEKSQRYGLNLIKNFVES